ERVIKQVFFPHQVGALFEGQWRARLFAFFRAVGIDDWILFGPLFELLFDPGLDTITVPGLAFGLFRASLAFAAEIVEIQTGKPVKGKAARPLINRFTQVTVDEQPAGVDHILDAIDPSAGLVPDEFLKSAGVCVGSELMKLRSVILKPVAQ